jgi:hypothetical protein
LPYAQINKDWGAAQMVDLPALARGRQVIYGCRNSALV